MIGPVGPRRLTGTGLAVLLAAACAAAAGAPAAPTRADSSTAPRDAFLEQYAATYHFTLGRPAAIRVTPSGDAVLFLRSGPRSFVQDLYAYDTAARREALVLSAASLAGRGGETLSIEERARRERQRQAARGIASFQLSQDGRRLLVPYSDLMAVLDRDGPRGVWRRGATLDPTRGGGAIDPQLSPDGARVAWVRDGDLHVTDIGSGRAWRLTEGGCDTLTNGLAEFVAQEEMDRFSGYWWSPDSRRIAYESADLARVETLHIADPVHPERESQAWRYPRAGTANADVRLGIVPAEGGPTIWVAWDRGRYPYLASVGWEEHAPLTILVQNRRQTEEALLAVDERSGRTTTLLVEKDAAWLNLDPSAPRWLEDGSGFLWTTERGGAWQLELRARDGRLVRALTTPEFGLHRLVHVDDRARMAWVEASPDPTELHVWRVPLDGRDGPAPAIRRAPHGLHGAIFGRGDSVWVQTFEGPADGLAWTVRRADGSEIGTLRSVAETPLVTAQPKFVISGVPGGLRVHGVILAPRRAVAAEPWPVIVSVYGGPHVQTVLQARDRYALDQWIADHGFVVVSFDGRGTPGRGRAWERAIRRKLGQVPLEDQIAALRALGAVAPGLDLERVGIFGWSFGGYLSATAAMRRPDVFRAAVAGAPVTDWLDYDTHYTERYLDLPRLDPEGYRANSVLTWAPDLKVPLMIIHGTSDDNVYFTHSLKLCDALFRAGKDFEFVPLAGFTHMVPDPVVTTRLYGRILAFFERHLGKGGPTP